MTDLQAYATSKIEARDRITRDPLIVREIKSYTDCCKIKYGSLSRLSDIGDN